MCEVLENGTVRNSAILKATPPQIAARCTVPSYGSAMSSVFIINVHRASKQILLAAVRWLILSENPCTSIVNADFEIAQFGLVVGRLYQRVSIMSAHA